MELRTKILTDTLDYIEKIFTKVKTDLEVDVTREEGKRKVDEASKSISDMMIGSLKKLAKLIDVDYMKVIKNIFGDESAEHSEKIALIFKEATAIYEKGESVFKYFEKMIERFN